MIQSSQFEFGQCKDYTENMKMARVLTVHGSMGKIVPAEEKVQIPFNFTLNFSIHQIKDNFKELTSQLKLGLHLTPYENLYMKLSNSKGSTVAPPTLVQSFVLFAVENTCSMPRVKQIRLSSILQHSLHGGDVSVPSGSPSPALAIPFATTTQTGSPTPRKGLGYRDLIFSNLLLKSAAPIYTGRDFKVVS
ncbi:hypothetical protein LWI28_007418 [Acer negundo]|uniref:DUF7036 domain-containing protein n=1 Tax=Acer negundo TaxID=4023 RepID=A0AAD5ICN3_ACENE|nr:hypothetical protein LWI28_007418 [Acer negundo]